ncbi:MAG: ATP-binding protein [Pseudomonadales bacterium]
MIHLVCGPIGAGKTTYAMNLAAETNSIRFSEDEWLSKLFVPDAPEGLLEQPMQVVGAWATEKYLRCRGQIWTICKQLITNNVSIILDGAAANKTQRDAIREKALNSNVGFQLHYVNAPADIRHKRVFDRNAEQGKTYSLEVTPAMFEHTESFFEPPIGDELEAAILIETS